jgi:hypothetical protein
LPEDNLPQDNAQSSPALAEKGDVPDNRSGSSKNGEQKKSPNSAYAQRIDQLTREKYELNHKWEKRYDELANEIRLLREERQQAQPATNGNGEQSRPRKQGFRSWEEVPQEDLSEVISKGPGENPQMYQSAFEERLRREREAAIRDAQQQFERSNNSKRMHDAIWQDAVTRFGADLENTESDLYQKANRLLQSEIQTCRQLGLPDPSKDPRAHWRAAAQAHLELHSSDKEELQRHRREEDVRKRRQAMEAGLTSQRTQYEDAVEKALEKGDIKAALKSLPIVRGLTEE